MEEHNIRHLEMIQNIITRMNTNSFQIKGFVFVMISAFFAVYAKVSDLWILYILIFPIVIFWFLDSYYLQHERIFRGIYNDVVSDEPNFIIKNFEMPFSNYQGWKYSVFNAMLLSVNSIIYISLILLILVFCWIMKH